MPIRVFVPNYTSHCQRITLEEKAWCPLTGAEGKKAFFVYSHTKNEEKKAASWCLCQGHTCPKAKLYQEKNTWYLRCEA